MNKDRQLNKDATLLGFFRWTHLPPELQDISKPFSVLAYDLCQNVVPSDERTVALRKLLESKDAAVRARTLTR